MDAGLVEISLKFCVHHSLLATIGVDKNKEHAVLNTS